jgi:two-component system cell cycle sensor histidine kinase/response regulator CckA
LHPSERTSPDARYWSLRTYFLALIGLFAAVAGGAGAYVHVQTGRDARTDARRDAAFAAKSGAKQVGDDLAGLRSSIIGLAATPGIDKALVTPAGCSLSYAGSSADDLGHIDIIRRDGTPMCSSRLPPTGKREGLYGASGWLAKARTLQQLTAPIVDPASGHRVAVIAAPIARGGVVAGFFDLTALGPHLSERYGGRNGAEFLVASADGGEVLARSIEPGRWIGAPLGGLGFSPAAATFERADLDGTDRFYGETRVAGVDWLLAAGEDKATALAAQSRLERRQLLIISVGLLLFLIATTLVHRRLARPIAQLGNELRSGVHNGRPAPVSIPKAGPKELRSLFDDVNALVSSVTRELQARKEAGSALARSEETYRQLFERHPASMFVIEPETLRVVAVNDCAVTTYGYTRDEFLSMTVDDIREPDQAAATLVTASMRRHRRKDGTVIEADVSPSAIEFDGAPALLVLAEDVTEKNHLQRQLKQIYKMEAVGQLAGGIAHDFNNLLTVISGFSVRALDHLARDGESAREDIVEVQRAAERASDLTRQLLAYSRQQVLEKTSLDLNCVVRESEALLRRVIGDDIVVATELADDLGRILADEGQLSQVLMNLAVNARDAMPGGGKLTIRTRNADLDAVTAAALGDAPRGEYVVLDIGDTGTGMDEETRQRLFEPFFTTKPAGYGTGLGLATVFGVVKQSDGYITAHSTLGAGTTFTIYLPRDETPVGAGEEEPLRVAAARGGDETILLVEDEPVVRALVVKMLAAYGYTVLPAAGPEEALQVSREHEVHAVVTDVVMPGMNGRVLVEELRRDRPDLRALFTSGYTSDAVLERGVREAEVAFLQKPFTSEALATKLRQLLDG